MKEYLKLVAGYLIAVAVIVVALMFLRGVYDPMLLSVDDKKTALAGPIVVLVMVWWFL